MKVSYLKIEDVFRIVDANRLRLLYIVARNYRIKVVTPLNSRGVLVGVSGLIDVFGFEMAVRLCQRAQIDTRDKSVFKPHGYKGLKVVFYYK